MTCKWMTRINAIERLIASFHLISFGWLRFIVKFQLKLLSRDIRMPCYASQFPPNVSDNIWLCRIWCFDFTFCHSMLLFARSMCTFCTMNWMAFLLYPDKILTIRNEIDGNISLSHTRFTNWWQGHKSWHIIFFVIYMVQ